MIAKSSTVKDPFGLSQARVALANDVGRPLQNFHLTCSLDSSLNPA